MRDKMSKTKRVGGVDLPPSCFAYVGSIEDTSTWKFCVHIPGDSEKTINQIKNGLSRFDFTKGLPDSERAVTWYALFGAARSHGIPIEPREFPKPAVEVPKAEVKAIELNESETVLTHEEVAAIIADADRRADAVLRMLGLE